MGNPIKGLLSFIGRAALGSIFLSSAVMNKIPNFNTVAASMERAQIPWPHVMLIGAIAFLIAGSISVMLGYRTRLGAFMLLAFLVLATYYFHPFWKFSGAEQQAQMIQFMKNLSMMGAMVFILANGPGAWSLDGRRQFVVK